MAARIWAKLSYFVSVHVAYSADFIETVIMVQETLQFKLYSSLHHKTHAL